jgi:hypothetical protein
MVRTTSKQHWYSTAPSNSWTCQQAVLDLWTSGIIVGEQYLLFKIFLAILLHKLKSENAAPCLSKVIFQRPIPHFPKGSFIMYDLVSSPTFESSAIKISKLCFQSGPQDSSRSFDTQSNLANPLILGIIQ